MLREGYSRLPRTRASLCSLLHTGLLYGELLPTSSVFSCCTTCIIIELHNCTGVIIMASCTHIPRPVLRSVLYCLIFSCAVELLMFVHVEGVLKV